MGTSLKELVKFLSDAPCFFLFSWFFLGLEPRNRFNHLARPGDRATQECDPSTAAGTEAGGSWSLSTAPFSFNLLWPPMR